MIFACVVFIGVIFGGRRQKLLLGGITDLEDGLVKDRRLDKYFIQAS